MEESSWWFVARVEQDYKERSHESTVIVITVYV